MTRRRFVTLAAAAAGIVAASILVMVFTDVPEPSAAARLAVGAPVDTATGAAWLAAGLLAWRRRPANRVGPLMVGVGAATILPWIMGAGGAVGFTLALLIDDVAPAVGAHAFLAYPSGRVTGRPARLIMYGAYFVTLVVAGVELLFRDYSAAGCGECPANLLLLDADAAAADVVVTTVHVIAVGLAFGIVMVLALRWRAATSAARRVLSPVLWTSVVVVLLFALAYAFQGPGDDSTTIEQIGGVAVGAVPAAFLVGLLRTRLQLTAVSDLVVELGRPHSPRQLRDALARALGDSSLQLLFWLPEDEQYVDEDGRPVRTPAVSDTERVVSVIEQNGTRLAAIAHDRSLQDDPQLVESVGAAARLALENSRLQAALRAQLLIVRDSRARIVAAGDAERRRIERNLHDGAQQRLLAIRLSLRVARKTGAARAGELDHQLAEIDAELASALDELRTLARGLHPPILTEAGLGPALEALARRAAIPVDVAAVPGERMPEPVETAAYYVAAEGLANIAKHAKATRARVAVRCVDGHALVEVADDGRGGANLRGSGLRGLRDRVEALDGTLSIESPPDRGTILLADLPCA